MSSVDPSAESVFTVGQWTVEPDRLKISDSRQSIVLQPRVMAVLQYLVAHAGQVVSHEALIAAVWEGRVVEDGAVYQTLAKLRKKLGDDPHQPRYIETIPTKGYCLIASVGPAPSPNEPVEAEVERPALAQRSMVGLAIVVVIIVSILAGLVAWMARQ
jgi:DNA-binding winged helix-turn-helix (wHTH) protein